MLLLEIMPVNQVLYLFCNKKFDLIPNVKIQHLPKRFGYRSYKTDLG